MKFGYAFTVNNFSLYTENWDRILHKTHIKILNICFALNQTKIDQFARNLDVFL